MYSLKSYQLRREEYNYLLAVLRIKLSSRGDSVYFIGDSNDLSDMLDRLKGLYGKFDELNSMTAYKCFVEGSLMPFRNELGVAQLQNDSEKINSL